MNSLPHDSEFNDQISLRWLIRAFGQGILTTLRRNKIAAILAGLTATVLIAFALNSSFDGLREYQQNILPKLLRLESGFRDSLQAAENNSGEWRGYYFENAQRQVRDILRAARLYRPEGYVAREKHLEFIRYYEQLESAFNDVGMLLRIDPNLDYVHRLKQKMDELKPIRDDWAKWAKLTAEAQSNRSAPLWSII
jgi:hypothetical protein